MKRFRDFLICLALVFSQIILFKAFAVQPEQKGGANAITAPRVTTLDAPDMALRGTVDDDGGAPIFASGFIVGTSAKLEDLMREGRWMSYENNWQGAPRPSPKPSPERACISLLRPDHFEQGRFPAPCLNLPILERDWKFLNSWRHTILRTEMRAPFSMGMQINETKPDMEYTFAAFAVNGAGEIGLGEVKSGRTLPKIDRKVTLGDANVVRNTNNEYFVIISGAIEEVQGANFSYEWVFRDNANPPAYMHGGGGGGGSFNSFFLSSLNPLFLKTNYFDVTYTSETWIEFREDTIVNYTLSAQSNRSDEKLEATKTFIPSKAPLFVPLTGVRLIAPSTTLTPTESLLLTAEVLPLDATKQTVEWISSDSSIAEVDKTGLVKANKAGTVTITAKVNNMPYLQTDGDKTASCEITVKGE